MSRIAGSNNFSCEGIHSKWATECNILPQTLQFHRFLCINTQLTFALHRLLLNQNSFNISNIQLLVHTDKNPHPNSILQNPQHLFHFRGLSDLFSTSTSELRRIHRQYGPLKINATSSTTVRALIPPKKYHQAHHLTLFPFQRLPRHNEGFRGRERCA